MKRLLLLGLSLFIIGCAGTHIYPDGFESMFPPGTYEITQTAILVLVIDEPGAKADLIDCLEEMKRTLVGADVVTTTWFKKMVEYTMYYINNKYQLVAIVLAPRALEILGSPQFQIDQILNPNDVESTIKWIDSTIELVSIVGA